MQVGYNIVNVQGLDCNWMDQMRGIPPKNTGWLLSLNFISAVGFSKKKA